KEATLAFLGARLKLSILTTVDGKQFNFLFFSRVEFQTWIDLIENDEDSYTDLIAYKNFIKNYEGIQRIENLHRIGNLLPYRDGTLHVYVHQLMGINSNSEVFLALQVDCFGGFFTKMYSSKISRMNKDPIFNEKFELNLNCSQALNINIYRRNPLTHQEFQFFAIGTFELHGADLSENYTLVCVPMIPSETRLYLVMSLKIISEEFNELQKRNFDYSCQNIQRISRMRGKVFGEDIQVVIRREGENVPLVVSSCIKEIEARGLDSSFIYVMQGNESRVNELITVFDMCSITGSHYIKQALYTPYDLAGVVLHYLRALPFSILPHPNSYLETDEVNTAEKILKVDFLLKSAPEPGRTLFHYLLDHMCRVCSHEPQNRMSSAIMAGIFSPVILDSGVSLTPVKQNNFSNVLRCIIDLMLAGYKLDGTDKI
ncbi:active breakpoint cluster region-related protein-like, partial [Argonauta hians]